MEREREERLLNAVSDLVRRDQYLELCARLSGGMVARAVLQCTVIEATRRKLVLEAPSFYHGLMKGKEKEEAIRIAYAVSVSRNAEEAIGVTFQLRREAQMSRAA